MKSEATLFYNSDQARDLDPRSLAILPPFPWLERDLGATVENLDIPVRVHRRQPVGGVNGGFVDVAHALGQVGDVSGVDLATDGEENLVLEYQRRTTSLVS